MYDRVLVPLDGSAMAMGALAPAQRLARLHGAALWLVTVREPGDGTARPDNVFAAARRRLDGDVAVTDESVTEGEAATVIADLDRSHPEALVCLTTRGRHPLGRALLGSVAHEVVRRSDQAVVVVGPRHADRPTAVDRLITCLDGTAPSEAILPWVARWSVATGAPVHLARVRYPTPPPEARIPPLASTLEEAAYLGRRAAELADRSVAVQTSDLEATHPADALLELVARFPDALLALATRSPDPVMDLVLGSNFTALLRRSPVPLLIASRPPSPAGVRDVPLL
jgi:nucleotide-binding universal stress UspA family protein